jgi:hypothetical protein
VTELEQRKDSSVVSGSLHCRVIAWPVKCISPEPKIYCAYNRTRDRFLSTHVDLIDLQSGGLSQCLAALTPDSKAALWLAPFRGISPDHATAPIDLVYLDRNHCVLAVVESFPIFRVNSSIWPTGTVLALPAQAIASSGTLAGDQLILCSPQKMRLRLNSLFAKPGGLSHDVAETAMQIMDWEDIRQLTIPPKQFPASS